jgi:hypothetical protein
MRYKCFTTLAACALLAACGGSGDSSPMGSPPPPPATVQLAVAGVAVTKIRSGTSGIAVMEEKLHAITDPVPERKLTLLDDAGAQAGQYAPPAGWSLIDFARHASGETTVALATARDVKLVRLDRSGAPIDELAVSDPQAATDPYYDNGGVHDDGSLLPFYTRDAVSIAPVGEGVAMALRTGRNAVVAYRFDHGTAQGYTKAWRTLVEPGLSMFAIGITSGTFDTFGQLMNHWNVHLDTDAAGGVAVAVVSRQDSAPIFARHADYFGEAVSGDWGVLVTRLAADGRRLGTTPIASNRPIELHGLRADGDDLALAGRVFSAVQADGAGWDAYTAHVDRASGLLRTYANVDVDRGDILFDVVALPQGRFLAAGATGYTENPSGASISEQAAPLLVVLESDGSVKQRIAFTPGPRQNQLRSLAVRGTDWLVGGMVDGPGTHSGDGDPALIKADGFVRQTSLP